MKKIFVICFCLLFALTTKAQLENTSWEATFYIPDAMPMVLQFKADTMFLKVAETRDDFEVMHYTVKNDTLSYTKISGNSDCGPDQKALYKIEIKDDLLFLTVINDECEGRANATPSEGFKKIL